MPNFTTHAIIGLIVGVVLTVILPNYGWDLTVNNLLLFGIAISIFYAVLPDFDMDNSKINNFIEVLLLLSVFVLIIQYYYSKSDSFLLPALILISILTLSKFLKHRGYFHSLKVGFLLSLPLLIFNPVLAIFAFAGWFSHLVLDGSVKV